MMQWCLQAEALAGAVYGAQIGAGAEASVVVGVLAGVWGEGLLSVAEETYDFAAGTRTLSASAPDLPCAFSAAQLQTSRQCCTAMRELDSVSCLLTGCTHIQFEKALGMPGSLKTSEYLLLAGPVGKRILEGSMHPSQQTAVFQYLDLLGSLWEKSIMTLCLAQLESDLSRILESLDFLLPSWGWTSTVT
ncbi:hypothetical protein ABBQ38_000776 [Trebouxia sp. C0009 RCD-2024]